MCTDLYDTAYDAAETLNATSDAAVAYDDYVDDDETGFDFAAFASADTEMETATAMQDTEDIAVSTATALTNAMSESNTETTKPQELQVTPQPVADTFAVPNVTAEYQDGTVELAEEHVTGTYTATTVKTQPEVNAIAYPCVWLKTKTMPGYIAQALSALLTGGVYDADVNIYPVYAEVLDANVTLHIGYIDSKALRNLLSKALFATFDKCIKFDADCKHDITGEMMYAMCTCCDLN